jgi:ABC-type amino acid transport substrate-binding protein
VRLIGGVCCALVVTVLGLLVLSKLPGEDHSLDRVHRSGSLVFGLDPSYQPFEVVNGVGQLDGFDVDLARALARRVGIAATFDAVDFGSLYDGLEVGRFDAILGGISPTTDQGDKLGYTRPYFDAGLVVLQGPPGSGSVLGYESGSDADVNLKQVADDLKGYDLRPFVDQDQLLVAIKQQTIRGAIVDAVTATTWKRDLPGVSVLPGHLTRAPYVIATRRADGALLHSLDQALQSLIDDGYVSDLERKWLS